MEEDLACGWGRKNRSIRREIVFRTKILDLETASAEAQIALTLREVCGLSTQAVARAFLVSEEGCFPGRESGLARRRGLARVQSHRDES
jgi:hypothetical protein